MGTSTKFRSQTCHEIWRKTIFHVIMSLKSLQYKKSCVPTCKSLKFWGAFIPCVHLSQETPRLAHWVALKWNHWLFDACLVLWRLPHMFIAAERSRETCKNHWALPHNGSLTKGYFLRKTTSKVWMQMSQAHSYFLLNFLAIV